MHRQVAVATALIVASGMLHAADQTILGKQLLVKDPRPGVDPTKRRIIAEGKEQTSADAIVGDPTVAGATVTIFESGAPTRS